MPWCGFCYCRGDWPPLLSDVAVAGHAGRSLTEEVVMTRASEELEEREMIMPLLAVVKSELATLQHRQQHKASHSVRHSHM
jgi:hypothetical protein